MPRRDLGCLLGVVVWKFCAVQKRLRNHRATLYDDHFSGIINPYQISNIVTSEVVHRVCVSMST